MRPWQAALLFALGTAITIVALLLSRSPHGLATGEALGIAAVMTLLIMRLGRPRR